MSETKTPTLSTPVAILIGAVIIAVGLIIAFGGKGNASPATQKAPGLSIAEAAKKSNLDLKALETCIAENEEASALVAEHEANAIASGGNGTPFNVIIGPDGQTFAASGALPAEAWNYVVDSMLGIEDPLPPVEGEDLSKNVNPVTDTDLHFGNPDAPVTIIEYSDIDCPFCKQLHPVLEQLIAERPDDVSWVYRHFPIESLHPEAPEKATAVVCAQEQGDESKTANFLNLLVTGTK